MPKHIVFAWNQLWVPAVLIILIALLEYFGARKVGYATARRALKPIWRWAWIIAGIVILGNAIILFPYYVKGTVWSEHINRIIKFSQIILLMMVLIWTFISERKWKNWAISVEQEDKATNK